MAADLKEASAGAAANPFLAFNLAVATETLRSWAKTGRPALLDKLVFQEHIALDDASVSRRHALIANVPNDVWLYDLGSTRGTRLDGDVVTGRALLGGVHRVAVGCIEVEIGSRSDLLV